MNTTSKVIVGLFALGAISSMVLETVERPDPLHYVPAANTLSRPVPAHAAAAPAPAPAPAKVVSTTFNLDLRPPDKAAFDVQVELVGGELPTQAQLRALAKPTLDAWLDKVKRVFITFYLPEMEYGNGAFASVSASAGEAWRVVMYPGTVGLYCAYRELLPADQVLYPDSECADDFGDLQRQVEQRRRQ